MATPINGVRDLRVNGEPLRLAGAVSYSPGGLVAAVKAGPAGIAGYSETWEPPFVEAPITDGPDVDLAGLQSMRGLTIVLGLRNGKSFVLSDASVVGRIEGTTEEGEFTIRFEGASSQEIN